MVIVRVGVDEQGKVIEAVVVKSVPGLDEAALDAARKYVFSPAMQRDRPVKVRIAIPITFKLR
jgi:protein TonB